MLYAFFIVLITTVSVCNCCNPTFVDFPKERQSIEKRSEKRWEETTFQYCPPYSRKDAGNFEFSMPPPKDSFKPKENSSYDCYGAMYCLVSANTINSSDDTSFRFIQDAGSEYKTVFSRVLWCKQADLGYGIGYNRLYLNKYNAYYKDQEGIEFEVDARIARSHAEQYAEILGRIPSILRKCLKTFLIIKGYHRIGSGAKNEMVMAHLDYLRELEMSGRIEEMFVHESGNACLNHHQKMNGWQDAVKADKEYISEYAKEKPDSEDVAESLVSWVALRCHQSRQEVKNVDMIKNRIPNRLEYFDRNLRLRC